VQCPCELQSPCAPVPGHLACCPVLLPADLAVVCVCAGLGSSPSRMLQAKWHASLRDGCIGRVVSEHPDLLRATEMPCLSKGHRPRSTRRSFDCLHFTSVDCDRSSSGRQTHLQPFRVRCTVSVPTGTRPSSIPILGLLSGYLQQLASVFSRDSRWIRTIAVGRMQADSLTLSN
jgi:hypothetical protein